MVIQQMWNMKGMIVRVITGATGIITKGLKKNVEIISGKHSVDSLQRIAILGTHHPPLVDEGEKTCDRRHDNYDDDDGGGGGGGGGDVVPARIEGVRERKGVIPFNHNLGARRKCPQLPVAIYVDPRLV